MNPRDREFAAELCASRAGLSLDPGRPYLLDGVLAPVARREGFFSVAELIRAVRQRGDERLVQAIVEAVAPGWSAFFRDAPVFEALGDWLKRCAGRRPGEPVRVWSAGCGAGQEPYSLAMLAGELGVRTVRILASDLSERRLERAQAGLYSRAEVQQGLSARRLVRHFENEGDAFAVAPTLRQAVRWRRLNLLDDPGRHQGHDLILCRYVLEHMRPPARARAIAGLVRALAPGGRLVLAPGDGAAAEASGLRPVSGLAGGYVVAPATAAAA